MKELWVRANQDSPWDKRKGLITTALESGANAVIVHEGEASKVKELGKIDVVADDTDADIFLGKDIKSLRWGKKKKRKTAFYRKIESKEDEKMIANAGNYVDYVVIKATDWKIIPLENLIAELRNKCKIIVEVSGVEDAKLALQTLEVGSDGVLVDAGVNEIKKIKKVLDEVSAEMLGLKPVKITRITPVGMGDRACIDTCSIFNMGEGMLVGSQSNALFLVHSETIETPYVETRPFRVNAGPVHAYVRVADQKTKYLSELKAGDEVLGVDWQGKTRKLIVGRAKIEKRPLMLIEAKFNQMSIRTLLQNAETIRLVDKNGKAISVVELKIGDEVLAYIEDIGRHFGMKVEESIEEK